MKLSKSILVAVPPAHWEEYIGMPFPDCWESVGAEIDPDSIERIVWIHKFIVCSSLSKGGELETERTDLAPDAIYISTISNLFDAFPKALHKHVKIASCGCCMTITLKKEQYENL